MDEWLGSFPQFSLVDFSATAERIADTITFEGNVFRHPGSDDRLILVPADALNVYYDIPIDAVVAHRAPTSDEGSGNAFRILVKKGTRYLRTQLLQAGNERVRPGRLSASLVESILGAADASAVLSGLGLSAGDLRKARSLICGSADLSSVFRAAPLDCPQYGCGDTCFGSCRGVCDTDCEGTCRWTND